MADRVQCDERERIGSWVSLGLDGRLTPEQQSDLERHLAACPTCRAQEIAMRRVSALLAASPMVGPSYGFSLRVERRLAERTTQRRQALRGMALLTSSLSLAGVGVSVILVIGLGLVAVLWFGSQSAWQQASFSIPQVASGLGLMGKGASLFLKDILLRYGLPVVLLAGGGVAVIGGVWAWLFSRRSKSAHRNGYA
jgi:predicted anti-sigma-YlaC factor YlaD